MLIGYARVSTADQDLQVQIGALRGAGCDPIYQEKASGGRWDRPKLQRLLEGLRPQDVVVVWKLDRLSRSLKDLLGILERIDGAGAEFQSLTESIDTRTPAGRMMMQMLGSFAEFERAMLRERTQAGLESARRQGRIGGRRPKLTHRQQEEIVDMIISGTKSPAECARLFLVHPSTVSRLMARHIQSTRTIP
jgi:DNA invertase Pin-like site-specific DNA recombinase